MMGFMKLSIEHALLVDKMRRALEAKDLEIEEYKLNGATLVRGKETLALFFITNYLHFFRIFGYAEIRLWGSTRLTDSEDEGS